MCNYSDVRSIAFICKETSFSPSVVLSFSFNHGFSLICSFFSVKSTFYNIKMQLEKRQKHHTNSYINRTSGTFDTAFSEFDTSSEFIMNIKEKETDRKNYTFDSIEMNSFRERFVRCVLCMLFLPTSYRFQSSDDVLRFQKKNRNKNPIQTKMMGIMMRKCGFKAFITHKTTNACWDTLLRFYYICCDVTNTTKNNIGYARTVKLVSLWHCDTLGVVMAIHPHAWNGCLSFII